jgi:hypothetical protein
VDSRNGYRAREWDTRASTVELAIPKLRSGSYLRGWLLQHRSTPVDTTKTSATRPAGCEHPGVTLFRNGHSKGQPSDP